jgi:SprT-like family
MARNVNRTIESKEQSYDQEAITPVEYSGLQEAYDHFNRELFDGQLPDVFITYQRHANSAGHFSPDRFAARVGKFGKHELALNPDGFIGRSDKQICSTLGHEQHHVWQQAHGKPSPRGYHNKEWAAKMKANGLQPSSTGMVGGRETGQRMTHYIVDGGKFDRAFDKLKAIGWKLNLQSAHRAGPTKGKDSKTKFTCSSCGQNAWGKPDLAIACLLCEIQMRAADAVVIAAPAAPDISYDPQVAAIAPSIEPPTQNSAKRKRGRPKGLKNRKLESVEQPKPRRGRPPGSKNKRK